MSENNNIILLQQLFDKYIYSEYTEDQLAVLDADDRIITSELSWADIYQYFPTKEAFSSSMQIYSKTIIQFPQKGGFDYYPLITRCHDIGNSVQIRHTPGGLKLYLYREPSAMICNSYFQEIFIRSFEKYNIRGGALYSILSQGYQYCCTPEELKNRLEINYINSMLKVRVLSPAEKIVQELYNEGEIPFYFNLEIIRSIIGRGSRIIEFQLNIIDNLVLLRQKRNRPIYINFIMSQLAKLFPFDYPFLEKDIKKTNDKTVAKIYNMIRYIEDDPDYIKMETSTLIKWKLQSLFNIGIARLPNED